MSSEWTREKNLQELNFELEAETTTLLVTNQVCSRAYRARVDEVLLTAFVSAFLQWQKKTAGEFCIK